MILTPKKIEKFIGFFITISTEHGNLHTLKKTISGNCIFYDTERNLCKLYLNSPFECSAYPLLINYKEKIRFVLDDSVCPNTKECCQQEIEQIKQEWMQQ